MEIRFDPIGVIHAPFKNLEGMPIQPSGATGVQGVVEYEPVGSKKPRKTHP
jgi:tRNA (Thr-GGU) A37 N-methylase